MTEGKNSFDFEPATWIPFRDKEVLEKVCKIGIKDITKHPNPDFRINVIKDDELEFILLTDMFRRIKTASDRNEKVVLVLLNPAPVYKMVAYLINKFRVDCSKVFTFNMDEWADENGNIADENYPQGFSRHSSFLI